MKPVSRALLLLALVAAAVNLRPGITSLAPLIERIAQELSLSRGFISLTTALPVLCMGLLAPLAPRLAVRLGLERTITLCLGAIALALVLRLVSHSSSILVGSAVLLGAAIAIAGPLLSGFIKRHFAGRMGQVLAWYSLSMAIGGAIGVVLTMPVTQLFGDDWSYGLAIWVVPALLAVVIWCCLPKQHVEPLSQEDASAGLPWREGRAWLISAYFALQAGLFYAVATWTVARYQEAGLSAMHSNTLFSLAMLMGLPSSFVLPMLVQRFNRYLLMVGCGSLTLVSLVMITFAPTFIPEFWALTLGFGMSGSFALSLLLPIYEAGSPMAVSRWTAMMLGSGYSVACLSPVLSGLARDLSGTYQVPFLVLTGMAVVMVLLAWSMREGPRSPSV
ncbi:MFS transporter [Pseudomonas straminea]|uniref:MFS transporter, CP family, cyanate transporter n=1 Tax=Pseudomonas straminea TaxID=47882 RepID=A0A1I1ZS88_PSEOC|nr:MFS transporter [Pseudomonas straminea]GLX16355.1 MFS transporter [Pseudomonas straminea]SFE34495.1 MFS transporter, CP family, cyanate transporter [Pseudomonas straminea]